MAWYRCGGGDDTSAVTATPSDVMNDKIFVDADGNEAQGTLQYYEGAVS